MSANPTTNVLGRMGGVKIRWIGPIRTPISRMGRPVRSANDDDVLARHALGRPDAVLGPGDDLHPAALGVLAVRGDPRQPSIADREARQGRDIGRGAIRSRQPAGVPIEPQERQPADRRDRRRSAIQIASHEPVSSQRTSKSPIAPTTPGIGSPAVVR